MRCVSLLRGFGSKRVDEQFSHVALFYDDLMEHVSYGKWIRYLEERFQELNLAPGLILDVACGTGTPTLMLAERGFRVFGMDKSWDMIKLARAKTAGTEKRVHFFVQDMRSISLSVQVDVVLCLYDSLNFLLMDEDLPAAFRTAYRALSSGGLYIFDVVTEKNIRSFFNGQVYQETTDRYAYRWTNEYDPKTRICLSHFTGHCLINGKKSRFHEIHRERIYPAKEIEEAVEKAGFRLLGVRDAFTDKRPSKGSYRLHFECRKE